MPQAIPRPAGAEPDAGQLFDRFLGWHRSRMSGPDPPANLTNGGGCRAEHLANEVRSE